MAEHDDVSALQQLGSNKTEYKYATPSAEILESFPNKFPKRNYIVLHDCPEFTSLCPKTGQPDYAHIRIKFIPDQRCVESKSLKLYLGAYRSEGSFMETICNRILDDLVACMDPRWIEVTADFNPRGGIGTSVYADHFKQGEDYDTLDLRK